MIFSKAHIRVGHICVRPKRQFTIR
jgi:hypothetical protein